MRALFDIAFHNEGKPTQIKDICERGAIPARFLEQIFRDLKRAGLVAAKRGPRGGYQLARPAPEIRLGDVVRALEGPVAIGATRDDDPAKPASAITVTESIFRDVSRRVEACLDEVTIADICRRADELGLRRRSSDRWAYVI